MLKPASLPLLSAGASETLNVLMIWSAMCCPSGVSLAGVTTLSCQNMDAMSEADENTVTGQGLKTGALGLSGCMVAKLTTGIDGVGSGESVTAPAGYLKARSERPSDDM
jgi:hypothetical protein